MKHCMSEYEQNLHR